MLNRSITKREKVLLLLLVVALLCLFYYQFVKKPVERRIRLADTSELEVYIAAENAKAAQIAAMQAEMEANKDGGNGYVSTYNNFNAEANALNTIFLSASSFNFSFHQPIAEEDVVRREIGISFTADDYQIARDILQRIHDLGYRCLIQNVNITAANNTNYYTNSTVYGRGTNYLQNSPVNCSLTVIFYETLYDATTEEGLAYAEGSSPRQRTGLGSADVSGIERSDLETAAESWASAVLYGEDGRGRNPYAESYIAESTGNP